MPLTEKWIREMFGGVDEAMAKHGKAAQMQVAAVDLGDVLNAAWGALRGAGKVNFPGNIREAIDENGAVVYVNLAHVVSITPAPGRDTPCSNVHTVSGGPPLTLKGAPGDVYGSLFFVEFTETSRSR